MYNEDNAVLTIFKSYNPIDIEIKDFRMIFKLEPTIGIEVTGTLPDINEFYIACRTNSLPLHVIDMLYVTAYHLVNNK